MTQTMVPEARALPLRRLLDSVRPGATAAAEEHLHYDRGARVWRTHAELAAPRAVAWLAGQDATASLQECA